MSHNTVTCLQHAFDFAAMTTDWKALQTLTEVAESATLLLPECHRKLIQHIVISMSYVLLTVFVINWLQAKKILYRRVCGGINLPSAVVAFHGLVTSKLCDRSGIARGSNFFLPQSLLLSLFSLTCLFLRHFKRI